MRPKETYDGAVFSGNSAMAYNLVRLYLLNQGEELKELAERQLSFLYMEAKDYPAGHAFFLLVLQDYLEWPETMTIVVKNPKDLIGVSCQIPLAAIVKVLDAPTEEYGLVNDRTTYYMCSGHSCKPPVNTLREL